MQWEKFAVERLPVPKVNAAKQRPLVRLVDRILADKSADPEVDTTAREAEINSLVYELYGLTADEIQEVCGSAG